MVALLVLLTIIVFLTIDYFAQRAAARRPVPATAPSAIRLAVEVPPDLTAVPAGVFLAPGHAWLGLEPAGTVRVGTDRLPPVLLGGVDAVDAVPAGTELRRGDPIARLRRHGRTVEVPSPVDGVVAAANPVAAADPAAVAADPFGRGWLAMVVPHGLADGLKRLFVAEEATDWMRAELGRLRDALVGLAGGGAVAAPTLPDGGLPLDGLAERLDDEAWRRLVASFLTADLTADLKAGAR